MEGSAEDSRAAPESWEVADLDNRFKLMLSSDNHHADGATPSAPPSAGAGDSVSDDIINQVDQFLRDAIQNPRERLSSEFYFSPL